MADAFDLPDSARLERCISDVMAKGRSKSSAIAICRASLGLSEMIRWIEPFAYQVGKPFRVMPVGTFKRGDRTLTITKDDLQQMAANFESGKPRWSVPLYFGHPTAEQPDPPKVGNVKRVFLQDDGLYAEPEYTEKGQKSVEDGEYQFVSPGILWSKNGSAYVDEQGRQHDNVIEHVALTNRPFFGQNVALFSTGDTFQSDAVGKVFGNDVRWRMEDLAKALPILSDLNEKWGNDPNYGQVIVNANGAMKLLMAMIVEVFGAERTEKMAEHENEKHENVMARMKRMLRQMLSMMGGEEMSEDFAVWTTAFMNDLPDSSFLYIESGGEKEDGKTKPRSLRHFPYKDASGKVDMPHLRNALARIPQSSLPVDVKERVAAKARRIAEGTGEIEVSEKTSEVIMATANPQQAQPADAFTVTAEEFAALKAKAEKAEALEAQVGDLKTQADVFATKLADANRQRRRDQLVTRAEQFIAIPVKAEELADKLLALEEKDAELFKYFDGLLGTLDKQLIQADLFSQKSDQRVANADTFEAAIEAKLAEKFGGDRGKYEEAAQLVGSERPDLAHRYWTATRGKRE